MNEEQQRIKIAEACGWKYHGIINGRLLMWPPIHGDACQPPDYLNDLNAMHEAVMSRPVSERISINYRLAEMLREQDAYFFDRCINATAAQRAEAFVRTLNLWTE